MPKGRSHRSHNICQHISCTFLQQNEQRVKWHRDANSVKHQLHSNLFSGLYLALSSAPATGEVLASPGTSSLPQHHTGIYKRALLCAQRMSMSAEHLSFWGKLVAPLRGVADMHLSVNPSLHCNLHLGPVHHHGGDLIIIASRVKFRPGQVAL